MKNKATLHALLLMGMLTFPAFAEDVKDPEGEIAYVINDYRYVSAETGGDPDSGHALCGTRCNALSIDYLNYMMVGGWELRRVAINREITIPLDNPFLKGNCICTADEYLVKVITRNSTKPPTGN